MKPLAAIPGSHRTEIPAAARPSAAWLRSRLLTTFPEPRVPWDELDFRDGDMRTVRNFVEQRARHAGLDQAEADAIIVAATELATNSVRHAGGRGKLRTWQEGPAFICEVQDTGQIDQPLWGRERRDFAGHLGRGSWLINQLCDLVQVRTLPTGNVIRIQMTHRRL
jgi:anti-sigma regulatory factor (Ser/Thr protein kinase)